MTDSDKQNRPAEGDRDRADLGRERSEASPPPGAGVANSDRGGQAVSENPVLRTGRNAGDVLGDRLLEGDLDEDAGKR